MNKIFKNRIVIAFIALVLALICGFMFFISVNSMSSSTNAVKITTNVPKGTLITENMVKVEKIGGHNITDIATNKNEVVGKYACTDLVPEEVVMKKKVADSITNSSDKFYQLDGTKSAISVTIKTFADGLSDKLLAGDIVSCIVTDQTTKKTSTPAELTYLEVLAVTQDDGKDKQSDAAGEDNMATVTVLAAPKQAEMLAGYDNTSDVHFALVYRGNEQTAKQFLEKQDSVL